MEELYQRFLEGEDSHVAQEDDPFWDPVEAVHLGSAHVWLQPLAYCMKLEEQVEFLSCDGTEEAMLHIRVTPCSPAGQWVSPSPLAWSGACRVPEFPRRRWSAGHSVTIWLHQMIFAMATKLANLESSRAL